MKHYYAFSSLTQDKIKTIALLPLTKDAAYHSAFFNYNTDELVLESKDVIQNLKIYPKMDKWGMEEQENKNGKMKNLYERRLVDENVTFRLSGEDMNFFIDNFVENAGKAFKVIQEAQDFVKERKAKEEKEKLVSEGTPQL